MYTGHLRAGDSRLLGGCCTAGLDMASQHLVTVGWAVCPWAPQTQNRPAGSYLSKPAAPRARPWAPRWAGQPLTCSRNAGAGTWVSAGSPRQRRGKGADGFGLGRPESVRRPRMRGPRRPSHPRTGCFHAVLRAAHCVWWWSHPGCREREQGPGSARGARKSSSRRFLSVLCSLGGSSSNSYRPRRWLGLQAPVSPALGHVCGDTDLHSAGIAARPWKSLNLRVLSFLIECGGRSLTPSLGLGPLLGLCGPLGQSLPGPVCPLRSSRRPGS